MNRDLAVVVLAGGEGRRMGGDKPLRLLAGISLISRALAKARAYSPLVAVSVRRPEQVGAEADAPLIGDWMGVEGPLAGLAAGLDFARRQGAKRLLTIPCDMPLLPTNLALHLSAALEPPARAAIPTVAGRTHPACTLWTTDSLRHVDAYVATGRASLHGFAEWVGVRIVACGEWDEQAFTNANTAEDLVRLQALA